MLCFIIGYQGNAQSLDDLLDRLDLNQALYPPEDILSTKSLVLLSVPEDSQSSEWQILVDELQEFFASVGLDAIAWLDTRAYQIQHNIAEPIPEFILEREPKNVVLVQFKDEDSPVFVAIGKFNGEQTLWNKGDAFWARQSVNLEGIISELALLFRTDQFYQDNLLVNENPEFFYPEFEFGLIAKSVPPRMREFKTYIEPFNSTYPEEIGLPKFMYEPFSDLNATKQEIRERNYRVEAVATDTLNAIFVRDYTKTIQELRRDGFQYALKYVRASEKSLFEWIPFENRPKPTEKIVYKFFLDDLRNNNNYVGKTWDADENWNTALTNFLAQIEAVVQENAN